MTRRKHVKPILVLALVPCALFAGEADVPALLAQARSGDPAQRRTAYAALREAGGAAHFRLAAQLDGQLRRTVNDLVRHLNGTKAKTESSRLTAALDAARKKTLGLIQDDAAYPDATTSGPAQQAVEAAIAELEAAWNARREGVRQADPALAKACAEAHEFAEVLASLAKPQTGGLPRCFELDALFERAAEPEMLAAWPILGFNAFGPSEATAAERAVLAQVNRYRLRLGMPVLKFDERLHRAAAWFARHCAERKLNSHYCEVDGKRDPVQRAEAEGHRTCIGEALAFNGTHCSDWRTSASHHRVLTDRQAVEGAVAIYGQVAVLMSAQSDPPRSLPKGGATGQALLWEDMARAVWERPRHEGLLRLARFLHGLGRKPEAAIVWREVARLLPELEEARQALGETRGPDGSWMRSDAALRAKDTRLQARIQRWAMDLAGADAAKRFAALREIADEHALELSAQVWAKADPEKTPDFDTLRAALHAAAMLALPGVEERALALLASGDAPRRALGAELAERVGGARSLDAMVEALQTNLSEYAFLRAIETVTGRVTGMNFTDDQATRETKVKQLTEWWKAQSRDR